MSWPSGLLARIEDASLNASAPPQQRWIDGWLVRFSPGKARRARSINAVASGHLALTERLQLATSVFDEVGLTPHFRITPFSQPSTLDAELEARGWVVVDPTLVMARLETSAKPSTRPDVTAVPPGLQLRVATAHEFARVIGELRSSPAGEVDAHAARLQLSPVPYRGAILWNGDAPVACAQTAQEGRLVGVYDVHTAPAWRGQGLAGWLCERLLSDAASAGAETAYLQVSADNAPAQSVYRRLGFRDGYRYHYRVPREWPPAHPAGAPAAQPIGRN